MPVPFGSAVALMAGRDVDSEASGLVYAGPPVRLLSGCGRFGARVQECLGHALTEIELLSVAPEAQRGGLGVAPLTALEEHLARRSGVVLLAKVRVGEFSVMRWYRRRGFVIAAQGGAGHHLCWRVLCAVR
ncbi:GNAT family N-acetyltransferase [Streptomyces violascens]|uniref:GNAT family N-acetyltransferase n=1 Tax=Streptomyces violascens TaxID=67381 RepID=UPI001679FB6C|nr:GNAT family N-acetyltransferase [Streptomyces violascens]